MRKRAHLGWLVACYVALAAYAGWAFYAGSKSGGGWASVVKVWPYLLAGGVTVAVFTVLFVWLALYSDRRGFDARAGLDKR